jgi:hypothetical protein
MQMSVLEHGLPASFFTRWRAVATGLFIGGAAFIALSIYAKIKYYTSEPTTAPACYGDGVRPGKEILPPRGDRLRNGGSFDERPDSIDARRSQNERLTLALRACTLQSCPKQAWKTYRSALFWYLSDRLQHTRRLYQHFGEDGLIRAREIYREPLDVKIEEGLRGLHAAGVFRFNDFRQQRDEITILVLKGGGALRPCKKE